MGEKERREKKQRQENIESETWQKTIERWDLGAM
jgi:hypothetical protein